MILPKVSQNILGHDTYNILYTSPWGPHPNGFLSWDSQRGILKLPGLELLSLCGAITLCSDLWSGWSLKQSCSYCQKLSNGVSHATCMHRFRSILDFLFSRVKLSILTPDLFFCHNLCCRCPNGSCEPILDIYTSITLRCYKKLFNAKCFDLCNRSLKVRESTRTLTPKMGAHLGVWIFMFTLSHTPLGLRPCKPLPWSRTQD